MPSPKSRAFSFLGIHNDFHELSIPARVALSRLPLFTAVVGDDDIGPGQQHRQRKRIRRSSPGWVCSKSVHSHDWLSLQGCAP